MITFKKRDYMTLQEFIDSEKKSFPTFIKPPLFCCDEEKQMEPILLKINELAPGGLKYRMNEWNTRFIRQLQDMIDKNAVTQENNPRIYGIIIKVAKNLAIPMPLIFTYSDDDIMQFNEDKTENDDILLPDNAFTAGTREQLYVFVSESIIENNKLTDSEIAALIGHEIGHALANHSLYELASNSNVEGTNAIKKLTQGCLFHHIKEYTADRAALLACRDLDVVVSLLKKISDGDGWDYDQSDVVHPNGKNRVRAVELFSQSLLYAICLKSLDKSSYEIQRSRYPLTAEELNKEMQKIYK